MRRDLLNEIKKEMLKKENSKGATFIFNPTLEECDYLYNKYNITSIKSVSKRTSIIEGISYLVDTTDFCIE